MSICQGADLFRSIWNAFCPTFSGCAAYQTYEWSPGYMTTALWNVIFFCMRQVEEFGFMMVKVGLGMEMIMSPTSLITSPILDPNYLFVCFLLAWKCHLLLSPDKYSHLWVERMMWAGMTWAYYVMKSLAYGPLYCMASFVVMDDHRQVSTLQCLLAFLCNVKPCIDHIKTTWLSLLYSPSDQPFDSFCFT